MELADKVNETKKRGRPAKIDHTAEILKQMLEDRKVQNDLMLQMVKMAQQNQDMMSNWFKMFQPPTTPNTSTTLDDREKIISGDQDWEPMDMEQIAKVFGQEQMDYQNRIINS